MKYQKNKQNINNTSLKIDKKIFFYFERVQLWLNDRVHINFKNGEGQDSCISKTPWNETLGQTYLQNISRRRWGSNPRNSLNYELFTITSEKLNAK